VAEQGPQGKKRKKRAPSLNFFEKDELGGAVGSKQTRKGPGIKSAICRLSLKKKGGETKK